MPDSYILGLGGTQIEIATFSRAGEVDFGAKGLLKANFVEGPHTDGHLAFEETQVRRMAFPLILAASRSISNLGLEDQEALLRRLARPGATLDLKPQGATTAVRFDVLAGRYEPDYLVHENREGLRRGTLQVETRPYGYWPTWITLASAASIGHVGPLTWTGSVIGDAPGLARLVYQPTVASGYEATVVADFVAWSLAARPSFVGLQRVASTTFGGMVATQRGFAYAGAFEGATVAELNLISPGADRFELIAFTQIPTSLEPAYRGRHRLFLAARSATAFHFYVAADVADTAHAPMASAQPMATVINTFGGPSPLASTGGVQLLDLGEITIPAHASGQQQAPIVRIWGKPATVNYQGIATPLLVWHGYYLLPAEGPNGIMPRGLWPQFSVVPSHIYGNFATGFGLQLDAETRTAALRGHTADLSVFGNFGNAFARYRGGFPLVTPSTPGALQILAGQQYHQPSFGIAHNALNRAAVSLVYRPRFQFMRGL